MNRQEMQERLPKIADQITEEIVQALAPIYCLLDFDKGDFCKLVEAIGVCKWMDAAERGRWTRLQIASDQFAARERYEKDRARLVELLAEKNQLERATRQYEDAHKL